MVPSRGGFTAGGARGDNRSRIANLSLDSDYVTHHFSLNEIKRKTRANVPGFVT